MKTSIQAIFREHFEAYAQTHRLPVHQRRAARALIACRTAALGGHIQACPEGHIERVWYNSCKHRVCPQCHQIQIERWLAFQQARLLSCPHHHLIFTLPHELNALWMGNTEVMTGLLFRAVRDTLMELMGDERYLGAEPGFLLTLHTWGRSLSLHPPSIASSPTGAGMGKGIGSSPRRVVFCPPASSWRSFGASFWPSCRGPRRKTSSSARRRGSEGISQGSSASSTARNVHLQQRYPHGGGVVKYLARYVRGGALKNGQIQGVSAAGIRYRFYAHGQGQPTEMTLSPEAFLRRYLQHVPAHRRCVVRSFGLYAHTKTAVLNHARAGQGQPPIERPAFLTWQAYYLRLSGKRDAVAYPHCGAPLIARHLLSRRGQDPPHPRSFFSTLDA